MTTCAVVPIGKWAFRKFVQKQRISGTRLIGNERQRKFVVKQRISDLAFLSKNGLGCQLCSPILMGGIFHADGSGVLGNIISCIACDEIDNDLGIHAGAREQHPHA
jgi:hypothetical protein